jgi:hypothetical protein
LEIKRGFRWKTPHPKEKAITVLNETKGLKGVLDETNTVTEVTPRVVEERARNGTAAR